MSQQTFVLRIDERLARRIKEFFIASDHGYKSLDELVEVALLNQLNAETTAPRGEAVRDANGGRAAARQSPTDIVQAFRKRLGNQSFSSYASLLAPLDAAPPDGLASSPEPGRDTLFVLTNRLSPIKVAARVLANMFRAQDWPNVREFQEKAARAARELGLRICTEDVLAERNGVDRRWIGYPIGDDERRALDRFIFSFTLSTDNGKPLGPMALLKLANVTDGRAMLTEHGWHLAAAPSPLIDQAEGVTFSPAEAEIMRRQIAQAKSELEAIQEFLRLVRRAAGQQRRVDELLTAHHPDWTADLVTAHRAAMIGRLRDLGVLEVSGRGSKAMIGLLSGASSFHLEHEEEGA